MDLKIRKFYEASDGGIGGAYSDKERIDYEGIVTSLRTLLSHVGDGSELVTELNKLEQSSNKLVTVWNSETSLKAKNSIVNVRADLDKVRVELNNLISEINIYNENANAINNGTF